MFQVALTRLDNDNIFLNVQIQAQDLIVSSTELLRFFLLTAFNSSLSLSVWESEYFHSECVFIASFMFPNLPLYVLIP